MPASVVSAGYPPLLKTIHWLTALVIIALLGIGWTMTGDLPLGGLSRGMLFSLHKSLGVLVLALTLLRLAWRVGHQPPPLPPGLKPWELRLVGLVHRTFYVLLLVQPLVGWAMYTMSPGKSRFFGLFRIPDLPFVPGFPHGGGAGEVLEGIHGFVAAVFAVLIVLHVGAALKHHFVVRDDVLLRMAPNVLAPVLRALRGER